MASCPVSRLEQGPSLSDRRLRAILYNGAMVYLDTGLSLLFLSLEVLPWQKYGGEWEDDLSLPTVAGSHTSRDNLRNQQSHVYTSVCPLL